MNRVFFDTNILIYAYDTTEPQKQARAQRLIELAVLDGSGVISAQVLGEFFHTLMIRKKVYSAAEGGALVTELSRMDVIPISPTLVLAAIALHQRFQTRYWDSLILAAAAQADCATVWSEDFSHGQDYGGVRALNPFAA